MILSGCGKKESDQNKPGEGNSKYKIAGIVFQEDQFFRLVQIGMKDAAAKYGVELLEGNSDNKPDKEIQLVNTYITNKVDAIVIAPLSVTASVAALKRAYDKGIKIIIHNNTLESDVVSAGIESDQRDLGAESGIAARKYIEEKLKGKAKIAILAFKSQLPEQSNARSEGFKSEVTKLPGVEVIAEQDAWLPEMAIKKAGDILTANPAVNIIWSANEGGTVGSVMAVKNAGKAGKVAVFGTDITDQLMGFLLSDDNVLQAVTGQRPFDVGYQAVETAVKILDNSEYQKKIIMPGVLLTRENPQAVREFQVKYKELVDKASK
jgi:simple sugar transport system substrate-binding protein/ribose transport system substrate-binding protein